MRALLLAIMSLTVSAFAAFLLTSLLFNGLDAVGFFDSGDCQEIFCGDELVRVGLVAAAGVALVPVMTVWLYRRLHRRYATANTT